jgi:hypothetical protein
LFFYFLLLFCGGLIEKHKDAPSIWNPLITSGSHERKDYTRTRSALHNTFPKLPRFVSTTKLGDNRFFLFSLAGACLTCQSSGPHLGLVNSLPSLLAECQQATANSLDTHVPLYYSTFCDLISLLRHFCFLHGFFLFQYYELIKN